MEEQKCRWEGRVCVITLSNYTLAISIKGTAKCPLNTTGVDVESGHTKRLNVVALIGP